MDRWKDNGWKNEWRCEGREKRENMYLLLRHHRHRFVLSRYDAHLHGCHAHLCLIFDLVGWDGTYDGISDSKTSGSGFWSNESVDRTLLIVFEDIFHTSERKKNCRFQNENEQKWRIKKAYSRNPKWRSERFEYCDQPRKVSDQWSVWLFTALSTIA